MSHQCGSFSDGSPKERDVIIPKHVPIWQSVPKEPLCLVGETYITVLENQRIKKEENVEMMASNSYYKNKLVHILLIRVENVANLYIDYYNVQSNV